MTPSFGRRVPQDWKHVERYPLRALMPAQPVEIAERTLSLPNYRTQYDQGTEGACVGYSCSWMMSILNRQMYDARRLYREAQGIDEWYDTPPEEGTSVRAAMDILRTRGHWRVVRGRFAQDPAMSEGIVENRWAKSIDEIRTAIHSGVPVVFGVNWYASFSQPQFLRPIPETASDTYDRQEWWIGRSPVMGRIEGGHAICAYRVSDRRQAIGLVNTWGIRYPRVWIPYTVVERLLWEDGEAGIPVDRMKPTLL